MRQYTSSAHFRAERHPAGYDYRARFPLLELVGAAEGGVVYAGRGPEGYAVVADETTLDGLLPELDGANVVTLYPFTRTGNHDGRGTAHGSTD